MTAFSGALSRISSSRVYPDTLGHPSGGRTSQLLTRHWLAPAFPPVTELSTGRRIPPHSCIRLCRALGQERGQPRQGAHNPLSTSSRSSSSQQAGPECGRWKQGTGLRVETAQGSGAAEAELKWDQRRMGLMRAYAEDLPTQAESVSRGVGTVEAPPTRVLPDLDYLQELIAMQQQGPRNIGFFGTRNMGFLHQQLIEILSYAMVITNNHIYTSGAAGTNAAVIRGALRAERPDLLTVILPQSLHKQPPESQELLQKVENVVEMPHNDSLPLIEASRLCNMDILSHVQQVICFAFHDSRLLMETCSEAKSMRKIVTLFYLD